MSLTGRPSRPPLVLTSSCQICMASSADLPAAASPPVSPMPKPIVIGSAACATLATSMPAANATASLFMSRNIATSQGSVGCHDRRWPLPAGAHKAVDAVAAEGTAEDALMHQVIEVSKRFTKRKTHLMRIEAAPKQKRHQLHRALRHRAGGDNLIAARLVVRGEARDSGMQPEERKVV